jgi:NADPH:quinone reductase-like Zn-dependent oxidoreductase
MKAIVHDKYGAPVVLEFREIERPVPGDDQVLVKVRAASVNARDWHVMRGDPYVARLMDRTMFGMSGPKLKVRGTDFAGVVEAVGQAVQGLQPGDEVYGEAHGAFAEYVCAPGDVVGLKPINLTFEQASAVPLAGNTALVGLRDVGRVEAGQQVLINGASGGVGTFAVQVAKSLGAEVTAVCSTKNVDLVRTLGADHVVDYTQEDFTRSGNRYDVLLDLVGNRSLTAFRRALTPTGTLILSGGGVSSGGNVIGPVALMMRGQLAATFIRRQRIVILAPVPSRANLTALKDLLESGALLPAIDRTYPLAETANAIHYLETDHARAKVILTI